MNKSKELINELCPNGVKYKTLGEIAEIGTGSHNTNEGLDSGKYPFYVRSQDIKRLNSFDFNEKAIIISGDGVGVGKIFHYVNGKYALHQRAYRIHIIDKELLSKFCYYYMTSTFLKYIKQNAVNSSVTSVRRPMLIKYPVPIPPLEVQREIVHILDNFTKLTAEITTEITAELTSRKKQYKYYKDSLLDGITKVNWVPILDIADTFTGLTYKPSNTALTGTLVLRSSNIKDGDLVFDDNVYVQMDNIPDRAIVHENDILICARNGSKALIGKAAIIPKHEDKMAFGAFMTILRAKNNINYKYLYFVWQSSRIQDMIHNDSGMPINQITKGMLEKIKIPLPSLDVQEYLVKVLDNFTAICSNLSVSLSAEINARQKQYEFYRDKLLNFKQL